MSENNQQQNDDSQIEQDLPQDLPQDGQDQQESGARNGRRSPRMREDMSGRSFFSLLTEDEDGSPDPNAPGPKAPRGGRGIVGNIITFVLIALIIIFVGRSVFTAQTSNTQTDTLITSEFVQAVQQDRIIDVTYNASSYTVSGSYYPAVTAGANLSSSFNEAFEALNTQSAQAAKEQGFDDVTSDMPEVTTSSLSTTTLGEKRNYTSTFIGQDSLMQVLSGHDQITLQVILPSNWTDLLISFLPALIIVAFMVYFLSQMNKANNSQLSFGKTKAKKNVEEHPDVHFDDVAGEDEAVEELQEIKDFLCDPGKYTRMGAKIPRGCLLVGPPGTGKTLLARAVAGEAGVPFFSISGSEFVEMFVGVGASRVRDLFKQAKEASPSIIFIDEIDAVGRRRGAGLGGGHDEREQTLNQLLVEMDGFEKNEAVVLLAATNRVDILDPALLRPGRFDRQIVVDGPDVKGREKILRVHAKNKPLAPDVDLERIAKLTSGMTGADLMNLMNEAALLTARRNKPQITMAEVNESMERCMAGPERKTRVLTDTTRRIIAYHESGHALVGHTLDNADPVHKITIVPRGMALGYTMSIPDEDRFLVSRSAMIDELAMFLGGRVAEEIFIGDITTGASNDLERATKMARKMVVSYGMSEALGQQTFGQEQGEVFLGRDYGHTQDYSPETAQRIDEEVARLMKDAHDTAYRILSERMDQMHLMAGVLLERETVAGEECQALLDNTWDEYLVKEQAAKEAMAQKMAEEAAAQPQQVEVPAADEQPQAPAAPGQPGPAPYPYGQQQ